MPDADSGDLLLVAAGDAAALDRVVGRWKAPVYAIFERTRDVAGAAEATADVFDALRRRASAYEPAQSAGAFIHRLVAERILRDDAGPPVAIPAYTLLGSVSARSALVRGAVAALPPGDRAAFLLTRVAGLSPEAASEALRVGVPELQKQVVHALALLRAALEPAAHAVPALAPVEKHFGPDPHPAPADLDHRLAVRLKAPSAKRRWGRAALVGTVVGAAGVLAAFALLMREERTPAHVKAPAPTSQAAAEAPAPPILRVENAPVTIDTVPASAAEEREAAALFPPSFLLLVDTLAALDPFFPEDASAPVAGPPSPRPTVPARSPGASAQEIGDRITFLRHLRPDERARLVESDGKFRLRPEAERVALWSRWERVRDLGDDASGGLRPLAHRVAALPAERRAALAAELRSWRELPVPERRRRFFAHPFAQALTGQERAAAEALLG